jgi:hypothetical protein
MQNNVFCYVRHKYNNIEIDLNPLSTKGVGLMVETQCLATVGSKKSPCWNQLFCKNGTLDHIETEII